MATSPATPNNGTVKFATNVPERISLAFAEGREVKSPYSGDQIMYTLDDGRRMYIPPFVADKIHAAGIGAHQPFEICKAEVTHGNRRTVEFQVKPLQGGRSPIQTSPAAAAACRDGNSASQHNSSAPDTELTRQLEQSIANARAARGAAPEATPPAASLPDFLGGMFVECGKRAIDALMTLEEYAHERGLKDFASRADVIERIAVHLSIGAQQRSSR